jgi:hypothetical protein
MLFAGLCQPFDADLCPHLLAFLLAAFNVRPLPILPAWVPGPLIGNPSEVAVLITNEHGGPALFAVQCLLLHTSRLTT